jgi:GT2 family glycosyltransferase
VLFAPRELPPLGPDVAQDPRRYSEWVCRREAQRPRPADALAAPSLVVLMVLNGAPPDGTVLTLRSLHAQVTDRWSLTIVVTDPHAGELRRLVSSVPRRTRRRINVVTVPSAPPNVLFRRGLSEIRGPAGALIFAGDVWAPDAVALLAAALEPAGAVYGDEDRVDADGQHTDPRLKPAFSPGFLASADYLGRPLAFGTELSPDPEELTSTDDATLEHEFAVSVCRRAVRVRHVPEVLCHRTAGSPDQTLATEVRRLETAPSTGARVSVVIPFRDQPAFLRTCLDSVRSTTAEDMEFVLIDNGSSEPEVVSLLERLQTLPDVQVIPDARPFNWAQLNNAGARVARGDVLLFLNNDVEALHDGWLSTLVGHALGEDVGAVGARLLYPDRRLQHCGIVVGLNGAAGHPLAGLAETEPGYLGMARATRECSAVTGACLATRRNVFEQLGGFDESLGVDLNDVDFCLRAGRAGYRVLYAADAELLHHESPSRGTAGATGDIVKFVDRWADDLAAGDRYLSPHLTRSDASCALAGPDEQEEWSRWFSTVSGR